MHPACSSANTKCSGSLTEGRLGRRAGRLASAATDMNRQCLHKEDVGAQVHSLEVSQRQSAHTAVAVLARHAQCLGRWWAFLRRSFSVLRPGFFLAQ